MVMHAQKNQTLSTTTSTKTNSTSARQSSSSIFFNRLLITSALLTVSSLLLTTSCPKQAEKPPAKPPTSSEVQKQQETTTPKAPEAQASGQAQEPKPAADDIVRLPLDNGQYADISVSKCVIVLQRAFNEKVSFSGVHSGSYSLDEAFALDLKEGLGEVTYILFEEPDGKISIRSFWNANSRELIEKIVNSPSEKAFSEFSAILTDVLDSHSSSFARDLSTLTPQSPTFAPYFLYWAMENFKQRGIKNVPKGEREAFVAIAKRSQLNLESSFMIRTEEVFRQSFRGILHFHTGQPNQGGHPPSEPDIQMSNAESPVFVASYDSNSNSSTIHVLVGGMETWSYTQPNSQSVADAFSSYFNNGNMQTELQPKEGTPGNLVLASQLRVVSVPTFDPITKSWQITVPKKIGEGRYDVGPVSELAEHIVLIVLENGFYTGFTIPQL